MLSFGIYQIPSLAKSKTQQMEHLLKQRQFDMSEHGPPPYIKQYL